MKFVLKPSLEHMALVKIAVSLWNQNDVRTLITKYNFNYREWKIIEEVVILKVPQLSIPQLLIEKLLGFIKPIGFQIRGWMEFHYSCFRLLPAEFYWSPHGTINKKKTAEMLVKDENLDLSIRYKLACINCLEVDIHEFWNKIPEDLKNFHSYKSQIIIFWSHYMKTGVGNISYKNEFHQSINEDNKVAVEYFLQKLTPSERKDSLVESLKNVIDPDIYCFLISEMDEDQQMKVFEHNSYQVLYNFLQWPLQSFFMQIANCMWDFLSKCSYSFILINIINKVRDGYKDWDYQKLFRECWQKSPDALKSYITAEMDIDHILYYLFLIKDKENIRLILKDATLIVKEKLIYNDTGKFFCECSIKDNEWDFLEYFIRECLPSKDEILKFKEEFEKRMMHSDLKEHFATKKQNWDELFCLSNDSTFKYDKRSLEDSESSSPKRFHSLQ